MGLLEDCEAVFGETDLYKILNLEKSSFNESKLKKTYYKLALKHHPDKNENDETATKKFQILGKIHKLLACKEKREWYDASGEIIEEEVDNFGKSDENQAWEDYWRTLYPKVTVNKLQEFEKKYKGSNDEVDDVKKAYNDCKGDMDKIMDSVILARLEDEERFRKIIEKGIEDGDLKSLRAFTNETKKKKEARKRRYEEEEKEAEEHAKFLAEENNNKKSQSKSKKSKKNDDFDLVAVMEERMAQRRIQGEAFLNDLEKKYCQPKKKSSKKSKN